MSLVTVNFYSNCLKREVTFQAILPVDKPVIPGQAQPEINKKFKALYLLHGYAGNCNDWLNYTNIKELADHHNLAVFMPSGENSFYIDDEDKNEFFGEYIGNELVEFTRKMFPISTEREDTFIAGLSMGGFGAIRNGFKYHKQFSKIIALSSALIPYKIANQGPGFHDGVAGYPYFNRVFGDLTVLLGSDKDPEFLVSQLLESGDTVPELYMACGDDDFLLDVNVKFHQFLSSKGVKHIYEQSPGAHTWMFWREYIDKGLKWALEKQ